MAHPLGGARFGNLRRVVPISRYFGFDRGQPVDRHYVERFLARHAADVRGRVLEVGDDSYTRQFGGDRVTVRDVLHVNEHNPQATIVDDLASGERIPSDAFDCVILTQTLHLVYDIQAAVRTLHRILKPGGVLLLTVPGISQLDSGSGIRRGSGHSHPRRFGGCSKSISLGLSWKSYHTETSSLRARFCRDWRQRNYRGRNLIQWIPYTQ